MSITAVTRSGHVFAVLRAEILRGALAPSSRLRLVELGERFSVSQSVVREALTRLAEQRIVVALPQQGFRVASLTLDDLTALTDARVHVEGLVFRLAVERGDLTWESSVLAAHHRLQATSPMLASGEVDSEWLSAHEVYHHALLEGCGNERLLHAAASLRDAAALYRIWSVPLGHDYDRDLPAEHRGMLDAVLARDPHLAVTRLCNHIARTSSVLVDVAERHHPDL